MGRGDDSRGETEGGYYLITVCRTRRLTILGKVYFLFKSMLRSMPTSERPTLSVEYKTRCVAVGIDPRVIPCMTFNEGPGFKGTNNVLL